MASKQAINLDYLQHIRDRIVQPLITKGTDGVPDALGIMKTYSLLREDIDSLLELTLWPGQKDPMSLIDSKVKAALTRAYNKEGIMIPYSVATNVKKRAGGSVDELDPEQEEQVEEEEEEDDISSDAMIKAKKRPAASRKTEAGGSETKKRKGKDKDGKQKNKKKQK